MTKEYEIGDADHALDRNQQFGLLRGNGHIEGGPAELDDTADPPTVTAPTPWSVYVDGETVEIDEGGNTVELPQPHPTLDRWDVIYVDPDGALRVESGEPAEVIGDRGLQARQPAPPSFAEIDGVVIAAAYRQFDEADGAAFSLSELFYDRRVRTLADVESLSVKNAEIEEGSAGELSVDSEPVDDVDVVRKLEADKLQDNIDSLNTAFEDHSERHENNGEDELNVEGLSGDLADRQDPKDHQERHHEGGPDAITEGSLTRQDPTEHASDHAADGRDAIDAGLLGGGSGIEGEVLFSDGTAAFWSAPEGETIVNNFETSGVWEKPSGVDSVLVMCVGGGAGGGATNFDLTSTGGAGGGGGGAVVIDIFDASFLPSTVSVTVGSGGAGVESGQTSSEGGDGGESSFGEKLRAGGGVGGGSTVSGSGAGGDGGQVLSGHGFSAPGGGGGSGSSSGEVNPGSDSSAGGGGGGGGESEDPSQPGGEGKVMGSAGEVSGTPGPYGGGAGGNNDGVDGASPGGGGGGAFYSTSTNHAGGDGADGYVTVVSW